MTQTFDISPFIEAESDRITADDLIAGPRTFTIERIEGAVAEGKRRMVLHLADNPGKPFIPCKGMVRLLGQLWGPDAAKWVGRGITLFRDPDVRFGADVTGGVRIAAVTHIERAQPVAVRASQKKIKSYKVEPLQTAAAKPDKAAQGAEALIARIKAGEDVTGDAQAMKQLAWLEQNRPELAAAVNAAMPNDDPFAEQEGGATMESANEAPPSDWIARIDGCETLAALVAVEQEWFGVRDGHGAPEQIDAAFDAMRNALKRKAA